MKIIKSISRYFKEFFGDIKDMILWIKYKEELEEQMRIDTHKLNLLQIEVSK